MKLLLTASMLFLYGGIFAQKINLEKLLSFYNKKVSVAENHLQSTGYEFRNRQTNVGFTSVVLYWDYQTKGSEHFVHLNVDTIQNITTSIGYEFYTKEEFMEVMRTIPKLNFNDSIPLSYRKDGTDKEFIRNDVNILLSTTKNDDNSFHYTLSICNCRFVK